MTPLLQEIARYYYTTHIHDLTDYCFVFPNKRAGVFFNHYLSELAHEEKKNLLHPHVTTISDFVTDVAETIDASRIEQLFILYRCYHKIATKDSKAGDDNTIDFNKFQYWGDVLLSDFSDVDKYMVDPREIFHNIEALKEISSNYLTPEQIEIIRQYWDPERFADYPQDIVNFWNHVTHNAKTDDHSQHQSVAGFIKIWQVLHELYTQFNAELDRRGLSYQGKTYRIALQRLKDIDTDDLPYSRYVFIGFNVLSTVEEKIFATMRDRGLADFFWDFASPAFKDPGNRATRFIKGYLKEFPSPADCATLGTKERPWPQIEIIGIPSVMGQAKETNRIINAILNGDNKASLLSTAIVLPDENMCQPVMSSLPHNIADVNITMGFPMRNTSIASLLSAIVSLHIRTRKLSFDNTYYRDDVLNVISHPIVRSIDPDACDDITRTINEDRLYNIPFKILRQTKYETLAPLFESVKDMNSAHEVIAQIENLLLWLLSEIRQKNEASGDTSSLPHLDAKVEDDITHEIDEDDTIDEDEESKKHLPASVALEIGYLQCCLNALKELQRLQRQNLDDLNVNISGATAYHFIERILSGETVSFEGKPLKGLQIMGMLETRAIDFDNVILLSMNERIFPRKHFSRSFIPPALRHGYGMSSIEHQESISAYYFYRLISRAKHVYLLYDSRTEGLKSGEPSRYINQLLYLYRPPHISNVKYQYKLTASEESPLALPVSDDRIERISHYTSDTSPQYLSASSINCYLNCPLQFTIKYIEKYPDENETKGYFDEGTYGSVIHEVVQNIYKNLKKDGERIYVDRKVIAAINRPEVIKPLIKESIHKYYLKKSDETKPLAGDAKIFADIMMEPIRNMLAHELDNIESFTILSLEEKERIKLRISDSLWFNFSYTIDRVDMTTDKNGNKVIRIIDYKTGGDSQTSTIDGLFDDNGSDLHNKAILQLFLYCNAYHQAHPEISPDTKIKPVIYKFKDIGGGKKVDDIKIDNIIVDDYRQFNDKVMKRLEEKLTPLFHPSLDPEHSATIERSSNENSCKYCKFTSICLSR